MKKLELDVHTHTIVSGHAYGTITEMAQAAAEKGLKLFGITEHTQGIPGTCADIYFANLRVVPRQMMGLELMLGAEINILDYDGTLSLNETYFPHLDLRIAGIHELCYTAGTPKENTRAIVRAIQNPYIDIICHPDDSHCPLIYEEVVSAAKEHHTLLEVNNNAMRMKSRENVAGNIITMLQLCKEYQAPVLLSSDAHHMVDVANLDQVEGLLEQVDFPEALIINLSAEHFKAYLHENRKLACEA